MRNRKRKRVNWEPSLKSVEEGEELIPSPRKSKPNEKQNLFSLGKSLRKLVLDISENLKANPPKIDLLIERLQTEFVDDYKIGSEKGLALYYFMENNNFKLFDWALENKNSRLLGFLLQSLSNRLKFLCVCHNDFSSLKTFSRSAFKNTQEHRHLTQEEINIFKEVLDIKNTHLIKDCIKGIVDEIGNLNSNVVEQFRSDLGITLDRKNQPTKINGEERRGQPRLFVTSGQKEEISEAKLDGHEKGVSVSKL